MLRYLLDKDSKYMFEWMQDKSVVEFLDTDFYKKTLKDCELFIKNSISDKNKHFAIINENDEYMGTVSLKNIDNEYKIAEMAITIRKCAMGKGYSKKALDEIFEYGKNQLGLKKFYWYVNPNNARALSFYDKHGYKRANNIDIFDKLDDKYIWYLFD